MTLTNQQLLALKNCVEVQSEHESDPDWIGFQWMDVRARTQTLTTLIIEGYVEQSYRSRQYTHYKVIDMDAARKAVTLALSATDTGDEDDDDTLIVPSDWLDIIIGHDSTKTLFKRSVEAHRPVHILLAGPPATAKSLFLDESARLSSSRFALGATTSSAGLVDFLIDARPRFLIIDEIDKMNSNDLAALLSLMESGRVTRLKRSMREVLKLNCWVFAGANSIQRLPAPLISRFAVVHLSEYSESEFKEIALSILTKRERVLPEIANEIVKRISGKTKDPRDAVKVGRLVHEIGDVDMIVRTLYA